MDEQQHEYQRYHNFEDGEIEEDGRANRRPNEQFRRTQPNSDFHPPQYSHQNPPRPFNRSGNPPGPYVGNQTHFRVDPDWQRQRHPNSPRNEFRFQNPPFNLQQQQFNSNNQFYNSNPNNSPRNRQQNLQFRKPDFYSQPPPQYFPDNNLDSRFSGNSQHFQHSPRPQYFPKSIESHSPSPKTSQSIHQLPLNPSHNPLPLSSSHSSSFPPQRPPPPIISPSQPQSAPISIPPPITSLPPPSTHPVSSLPPPFSPSPLRTPSPTSSPPSPTSSPPSPTSSPPSPTSSPPSPTSPPLSPTSPPLSPSSPPLSPTSPPLSPSSPPPSPPPFPNCEIFDDISQCLLTSPALPPIPEITASSVDVSPSPQTPSTPGSAGSLAPARRPRVAWGQGLSLTKPSPSEPSPTNEISVPPPSQTPSSDPPPSLIESSSPPSPHSESLAPSISFEPSEVSPLQVDVPIGSPTVEEDTKPTAQSDQLSDLEEGGRDDSNSESKHIEQTEGLQSSMVEEDSKFGRGRGRGSRRGGRGRGRGNFRKPISDSIEPSDTREDEEGDCDLGDEVNKKLQYSGKKRGRKPGPVKAPLKERDSPICMERSTVSDLELTQVIQILQTNLEGMDDEDKSESSESNSDEETEIPTPTPERSRREHEVKPTFKDKTPMKDSKSKPLSRTKRPQQEEFKQVPRPRDSLRPRATLGSLFHSESDIESAFRAMRYIYAYQIKPFTSLVDNQVVRPPGIDLMPMLTSSEISDVIDLLDLNADGLWENLLENRRKQLALEGMLRSNCTERAMAVACALEAMETSESPSLPPRSSSPISCLTALLPRVSKDKTIVAPSNSLANTLKLVNPSDLPSSPLCSPPVYTPTNLLRKLAVRDPIQKMTTSTTCHPETHPAGNRKLKHWALSPDCLTIQEQNRMRATESHLFVTLIDSQQPSQPSLTPITDSLRPATLSSLHSSGSSPSSKIDSQMRDLRPRMLRAVRSRKVQRQQAWEVLGDHYLSIKHAWQHHNEIKEAEGGRTAEFEQNTTSTCRGSSRRIGGLGSLPPEVTESIEVRALKFPAPSISMNTPWPAHTPLSSSTLPKWPISIRKLRFESDRSDSHYARDQEQLSCPVEVSEMIDTNSHRLTTDGRRQFCSFLQGDLPCPPKCNCAKQVDRSERFVRVWTDMEKSVFLDKFIQFPKNFSKISSFLKSRTVSDCIKFYYDSKSSIPYKALLKEVDNRRKNQKIQWNFSMLSARSVGSALYPPFNPEDREPIVEMPLSDCTYTTFLDHPPYTSTALDLPRPPPLQNRSFPPPRPSTINYARKKLRLLKSNLEEPSIEVPYSYYDFSSEVVEDLTLRQEPHTPIPTHTPAKTLPERRPLPSTPSPPESPLIRPLSLPLIPPSHIQSIPSILPTSPLSPGSPLNSNRGRGRGGGRRGGRRVSTLILPGPDSQSHLKHTLPASLSSTLSSSTPKFNLPLLSQSAPNPVQKSLFLVASPSPSPPRPLEISRLSLPPTPSLQPPTFLPSTIAPRIEMDPSLHPIPPLPPPPTLSTSSIHHHSSFQFASLDPSSSPSLSPPLQAKMLVKKVSGPPRGLVNMSSTLLGKIPPSPSLNHPPSSPLTVIGKLPPNYPKHSPSIPSSSLCLPRPCPLLSPFPVPAPFPQTSSHPPPSIPSPSLPIFPPCSETQSNNHYKSV